MWGPEWRLPVRYHSCRSHKGLHLTIDNPVIHQCNAKDVGTCMHMLRQIQASHASSAGDCQDWGVAENFSGDTTSPSFLSS
jgi:hypothetical protein